MTEERHVGPQSGQVPVLLSLVAGRSATAEIPSAPAPTQPEARDDLLEAIETSVIPRLLMLHRTDGVLAPFALELDTRPPPTTTEVSDFAEVCVGRDLDRALGFVEVMARQGLSLEAILLDLVGDAARLLGRAWERDERSFTEVTAGLGTLQQVVYALGPGFSGEVNARGRVVLSAAPGEQHTLGLHLVGEFVRRAGWAVEISSTCDEEALLDQVRSEPIDLLGFSVSSEDRLPALAALIERLRQASQSPALAMMVGGCIDPDLLAGFARRVGAAVCVTDARGAVEWLEECHAERD